MIMNSAKFIFCLFFGLLEMYHHLDAKNVIGPQVCNLDTVVDYDPNDPQKLKEQYQSENGSDSMGFLKFDSTLIASLQRANVIQICRCFAKVYYSRKTVGVATEKGGKFSNTDSTTESSNVVRTSAMENQPASTIDDETPVVVETDYAYCRKFAYTEWYQSRCVGLPVVKCRFANDKVLYLAESATGFIRRKGLRNFYLFELNQKEAQNIRRIPHDYSAINYPAGDFKFFAKAVNLEPFRQA